MAKLLLFAQRAAEHAKIHIMPTHVGLHAGRARDCRATCSMKALAVQSLSITSDVRLSNINKQVVNT